jgi:riboflavin synthase
VNLCSSKVMSLGTVGYRLMDMQVPHAASTGVDEVPLGLHGA